MPLILDPTCLGNGAKQIFDRLCLIGLRLRQNFQLHQYVTPNIRHTFLQLFLTTLSHIPRILPLVSFSVPYPTCRTEEVMAAVAAVVVVEEVTQTGTTTIPAFTPADS